MVSKTTTTTTSQSIQIKICNSLLSLTKKKVSEHQPPMGFAVPASLSPHPVSSFSRRSSFPSLLQDWC